MGIDGVWPTTGAERVVKVTAAAGGVPVAVHDRAGAGLAVAVVAADALMNALADRPAGPQTLASAVGINLVLDVKRNEVLLRVGSADAAVGLDDLVDAVAAAGAA